MKRQNMKSICFNAKEMRSITALLRGLSTTHTHTRSHSDHYSFPYQIVSIPLHPPSLTSDLCLSRALSVCVRCECVLSGGQEALLGIAQPPNHHSAPPPSSFPACLSDKGSVTDWNFFDSSECFVFRLKLDLLQMCCFCESVLTKNQTFY